MELLASPLKLIFLAIALNPTGVMSAEPVLNYLTDFKVPMQTTHCKGKAKVGDELAFKECMLIIEKNAYKCDKDTKIIFDKEFSNYSKPASEYISDIIPLAKQHQLCLKTLH